MYAQLIIPNVMTIKSKMKKNATNRKISGYHLPVIFFRLSSLPKTAQTNSPAALSPCHHNPVIVSVADDAAAGDVAAIGLATAAGH